MNANLLKKELRSLVPLLVVILFVHGVDLVATPLTKRVDEWGWPDSDIYPGHGEGAAMVLLILSFMAGFSLLPREHDERTIEFLDSLPVSRRAIFGSKVLAAFLVLAAGCVLNGVVYALLSLPNRQSFSGERFDAGTQALVVFLYLAYSTILLAHAVFLSFFRRFGLVIFGLEVWAVILAKKLLPAAACLDATRLVYMEYEGTRLVVPWPELALHGTIAVFALLMAYVLWSGPAERVTQGLARAVEDPLGKAVLGCGTALAFLVGFSVFMWMSVNAAEKQPPPVYYEPFQPVRAETARYRFTYPSNLRERAVRLIASADATYDEVRSVLGAREIPPVVVDLTERSGEHAGITSWQKIRMDVTGEHEDAWFRYVFCHETVHAFQAQESSRRIGDNRRSTPLYIEGMAEFVALRNVKTPERTRESSRRLAVAAVRRNRIRFDELCDHEAFRKRHDGDLIYAVGESWTAGLVRSYGEKALGEVLRAMARKDAPRDLAPLAFWQDTLQSCGYDLERVLAAWQEVLDEAEREGKDELDRLPRLSGGVVRSESGQVVFEAALDRDVPETTRFLLRVRDKKSVDDMATTVVQGTPKGGRRVQFRVSSVQLEGRSFDFQLGAAPAGFPLPYYEDWQAGFVPR